MNAIARTEEGTWPREILVLKRSAGYLRLHLPPLLYSPALATRLNRSLLALRGVRRVSTDRNLARLSVYYDPWLTDDRPILLEIDRQGTPLLQKSTPEAFTTALVEQRSARRAELAERGARVAYLGLLAWVHVWVFRAALRRPLRLWWVWALLAFGIWTHRRQIKATKLLPG
jgi:hypothetical protein